MTGVVARSAHLMNGTVPMSRLIAWSVLTRSSHTWLCSIVLGVLVPTWLSTLVLHPTEHAYSLFQRTHISWMPFTWIILLRQQFCILGWQRIKYFIIIFRQFTHWRYPIIKKVSFHVNCILAFTTLAIFYYYIDKDYEKLNSNVHFEKPLLSPYFSLRIS